MKNLVFLSILLLSPVYAHKTAEKPIRVAIIDTGYDFKSNWERHIGKKTKHPQNTILRRPKICKNGHRDFTAIEPGKIPQDSHGHGTHIAGVIAQYAGNANYCLVILKYYNEFATGSVNLNRMVRALKYAEKLNVDIVNFSGGGSSFSEEEYKTVQRLLSRGTKIVVAAGNDANTMGPIDHIVADYNVETGETLFVNYKTGKYTYKVPKDMYYPAVADSRIISVKALDKYGIKLLPLSNRGAAFRYSEVGNLYSLMPNNRVDSMSGTSQATAVRTGKIIKNWKR